MASETKLTFLPVPRTIAWLDGTFALGSDHLVLLDPRAPQTVRFAGHQLQAALAEKANIACELTASAAGPLGEIGITLLVMPEAVAQPEGYRLRITPEGITIHGHDAAGVFYGVCTLKQLLQQLELGDTLAFPCVEINDWPDFPARGVMLDISRNKVPQMETLLDLVDRLASWKVNQVQLYTEHTFAYRNHPVVWADASPMTGEEILTLDAYCRERFIELVPNQNSFGHMEHWLPHEAYAHLAETHEEFDTPWGNTMQGPFGLAPEHPGSIELVRSLYDELLPHFTSRQLNVGLDETIDLGQGASKEICKARGTGRVYLDFLKKIYADVSRRGYVMQFWGDIIVHYPDLVAELPKDAIALEWGYEFDHPFEEHGAMFAAAGVPFYVCPGTASWNSIAGRTDNALGNLHSAAENGLKHGAVGYLNTDWGDRGHWQYLPMSFLGFGMGAAYSWCLEANRDAGVARMVSLFAFDDPTGNMGQIAYDLGNVYQIPGVPRIHNSSVLFWILQELPRWVGAIPDIPAESFETTLTRIGQILAALDDAQMARPDADLVKREYANAGRLMRHACRRALQLLTEDEDPTLKAELLADLEAAIAEHKALWHARNRPGGLDDSLERFDPLLNAYRS
ncbi:MAG: family 20 glycosylhydrolase [Anaerolineae bacterium]|nr:family 20 glycosylhydrolase [Anaerolineae bacterium]